MNILGVIFSVLTIGCGAFLFVYGGYDDSPGAQLLGVVVVFGGIAGIVKSLKKSST